MSAVPPKHPKKKPRLDASQEPQPRPSSSGVAARPVKRHLRRVSKEGPHPSTSTKSNLPSSPLSPGFAAKASEIPKADSSSKEDEDALVAKNSECPNKDISPPAAGLEPSLPANHPSRKFQSLRQRNVSKIGKAASFTRKSCEFYRKCRYLYGQMSMSSNMRQSLLEHYKDPQNPEFLRCVETAKTLHMPIGPSSASSSSAEGYHDDEGPSKDLVCDKNLLPGSKSSSKVDKFEDRALKKSRRADVSCNVSKIPKNSSSDDPKMSSGKTYKTGRSLGWDQKDEDVLETITDNEPFFKQYRDRYGLVENSMEEDVREDYFSILPDHIIELILCTVPFVDFMNCRLVCKRWKHVIDNPSFMNWKKLFFQYKKNYDDKEAYLKMLELSLTPLDHHGANDSVRTLVNYIGKKLYCSPSSDMYNLLIQNPHGELADHVMKERFPEYDGKTNRVWCQMCVAILICESVWDILRIYRCLLTCKSNCSRLDIHNLFYCIALILFHLRCLENINFGLYYRVYYALYVIENSVPFCQIEKLQRVKNAPGKQSFKNDGESDGVTLTHEQIRILNHRFDMNQKIKIVALAGTGKTATLVQLARLYPQIKFLNIVFNKSINKDAKRKFPPNVVYKTAYEIAYDAVGKNFQHKLAPVIRPFDLIGLLSHNEDHLQIYQYGTLVLSTICDFMYSKDKMMTVQHVPLKDPHNRHLSHSNRDRILMDAFKIWQKMCDTSSDTRMTDDVYLKLYQLSKPNLDEYQCIMMDDAQDCHPVVMDIVMSQKIPVILVGDPYQQTSFFRGAHSALQLTKATHTYTLTKSFRCGPEVSYIASCVLEVSLNIMDNIFIGNTTDSNLRGETSGQFAIIARTSAALFEEAVRLIYSKGMKLHEPQDIKPFFVGGLDSYGFDQLYDIYLLKHPRASSEKRTKDKFICQFRSFHELYSYAKFSNDKDLKSKIQLVNSHEQSIPKFLSFIKRYCVPTIESATVVFSTAHKSKGLEFDTVSLANDFFISPTMEEQTLEEAKILYAAITRARKCLLLPEKITKILHAAHEKFEYPVSSKALLHNSVVLKCVQCSAEFVPHTVLTLVKRRIVMATGREVDEGPLCMKCRSDPTMRPDMHMNGIIMYLDSVPDNSHLFMNALVGPLSGDPPIIHDRFRRYEEHDRVFVINVNLH